MLQRQQHRRAGFTLVELMVAAALTVLIMTIISMAFQSGLTTLSHLKSMGDLAERLRIAQDRLRDDLEAEHFFRGTSSSPRLLSDVRYDQNFDGREVPRIGYFRIEQGSASTIEGLDSTGMVSTKRANPLDAIEFTIWRKTNQPDKMMTAFLPAAEATFRDQQSATDKSLGLDNYVAEWARVRWQLKQQQPINGVQLYSLHRSIRLLANGNQPGNIPYTCNYPLSPGDPADTRKVLSVDPSTNTIQRADMATASEPRPTMTPFDAASGREGDDLVLTNVVSFEVKPTWTTYSGAVAPHNQAPRTMLSATVPNTDYPFDDLPIGSIPGQRVFDTYTRTIPGTPPTNDIVFKARITALQIKIRVYEPKNNMTRQSTIIVKM